MIRSALLYPAVLAFCLASEAHGQMYPVGQGFTVMRGHEVAPLAVGMNFNVGQRRRSTTARTILAASIGAVAGFLIANATTNEPGIKSAELVGALAGAGTGVVLSLVVIPLF